MNRCVLCRAYCIPFPFCVVLVMDDTDEEAIFSLASVVSGVRRNQNESIAQLQLLVQQNFSGEIRRRRQVRSQVRESTSRTFANLLCV